MMLPGAIRRPADAPRGVRPADYITAWVTQRMPEYGWRCRGAIDRILLVRAETGAGKSTIMPRALLEAVRGDARARPGRAAVEATTAAVLCTQPRVLTAVQLAGVVAAQTGTSVGEAVGYVTGPRSRPPRAGGLVFATIGVLGQQLLAGAVIGAYRIIILDEVHELSNELEIVLAGIRKLFVDALGGRVAMDQLPFVILTSATMNPDQLAKQITPSPEIDLTVNIIEVMGHTYPIDMQWPAHGTNNYTDAACDMVVLLDKSTAPSEDILIFMPGEAEAVRVGEALRAHADLQQCSLLTINSTAVNEENADYRGLAGGPGPPRRVIIATAVAETGLTLPFLRHVIDSGWSRMREVYWPEGYGGLTTRPEAVSRLTQRRGRVGRTAPGVYHPLFTEGVSASLPPQQEPNIVLDGEGAFLPLVLLGATAENPLPVFEGTLPSLTTPPAGLIWMAAVAARARGFFDATGRLTAAGAAAARMRLPAAAARVLLSGAAHGVAAVDAISLAAVMTAPGGTLESLLNDELRVAASRSPAAGARARDAALAAAAPEAWRAALGGGLVREALADHLIEACVVLEAYLDRVGELFAADRSTAARAAALVSWCDGAGLSRRALATAAEAWRDARAAADEGAPLDTAAPRLLDATTPDAIHDAVTRMKRCLLDALRGNLLLGQRGVFLDKLGTPVAVALPAGKTATRVLALNLELRRDPTQNFYTVRAPAVSVLDGFIAPDPAFDFANAGHDWSVDDTGAVGDTGAVSTVDARAALDAYYQIINQSTPKDAR